MLLDCFITLYISQRGGAMEQFETQFKQVDVFPLVKYYMDELNLTSRT